MNGPGPGPTPFPTTTVDLEPETTATGRAYRLTVEVPNRYHGGDRAYPVVVVLDGQWAGGIVRDAFRVLPLERTLPEAVVVSVEHRTGDLRELLQLRAADYTPTPAPSPPETGVTVGPDEVGQAPLFRRVLRDQILPLVAERWRISDDRTLVGHSFSALFGLDTLLDEPTAFGRWVLASPSVWWDDRVMFRREAEHAARGDALAGRVFLSQGSDEGGDEPFGGHQAFHRQLAGRDHPDLDLHWHLFEGEGHQSVIAPAAVRGLRTVFA